jgi:hypothetical protein
MLMAGLLAGGLVLSGCDDKSVEILRDPDVRVAKGMTWAWRPANAPEGGVRRGNTNDGRQVVSRDVINSEAPRPERLESSRDWNTEANRDTLKAAIAKTLQSKGLKQAPDPAAADFWVDYHVAVKTRTATVAYPGGYPGVVCGSYGCWSGWGWGPPGYQNVAFREGTFVIDVALRDPNKLAYRGISHKDLSYQKPVITPYQAEEAANHLLKDLKPR